MGLIHEELLITVARRRGRATREWAAGVVADYRGCAAEPFLDRFLDSEASGTSEGLKTPAIATQSDGENRFRSDCAGNPSQSTDHDHLQRVRQARSLLVDEAGKRRR